MKARFYIKDEFKLKNENTSFFKIKKNIECIINASIMARQVNVKSDAYKILGADYQQFEEHLKTTVKNYNFRKKYKLEKTVNTEITLQDVINQYYYKNLFLVELKDLDK